MLVTMSSREMLTDISGLKSGLKNRGNNSVMGIMLRNQLDPDRPRQTAELIRQYREKKWPKWRAELQAYREMSPLTEIKYRTTPLPLDAERDLDSLVIDVALRSRNAVADLISRGLVRPLPDIGVKIDVWNRITGQNSATLGMALAGGPPYERQEFDSVSVPVPIIQQKFELEVRDLMGSSRAGIELDTTHAERAAEMVAELEEDTLINGATLTHQGATLRGYATHPDRIQTTAAAAGGGVWSTSTNVEATIRGAMRLLADDNQTGETMFYTGSVNYFEALADHKAESDRTALARALDIPNVIDIKFNQFIPADELIGIVMRRRTVDLSIAQDITTVPWETEGGARQHWRVFSSQVVRLKSDTTGQMGLIHVTAL